MNRKRLLPGCVGLMTLLLSPMIVIAQETATPNGIADDRADAIALVGAQVYMPDGNYQQATVLLRRGSIVDVRPGTQSPAGYFAVDMQGRYVYPGFVDMHSGYGLPETERPAGGGGAEVLQSSGYAYSPNDAIRAHQRAVLDFRPDAERAASLRRQGFSAVLSHHADGIARGTSTLVTLGDKNANEAVVVNDAAAHFSLNKGSSRQTIPVSLMGSVALLRQTYLDAQWFDQHNPRPFADESLEGLLRSRSLPQIMAVENWHQAMTVLNVGQEFEVPYIVQAGTDLYQRADALADSGARFIISVNYPEAPGVADPFVADEVSFYDLKHWELAPFGPRLLHDAGIEFAITAKNSGDDFLANLKKTVTNGLPPEVAIAALTSVPARMLGVEDRLGRISAGALANLLVTDGPLFAANTRILENWVRGDRFVLTQVPVIQPGQYELQAGEQRWLLNLSVNDSGRIRAQIDGASAQVTVSNELINMVITNEGDTAPVRLSGWPQPGGWLGSGQAADGSELSWRMQYSGALPESESAAEATAAVPDLPSAVIYPFAAYGSETRPQPQDTLIRNATVWTNEDQGTLVTDVLFRDGRIAAVGNNLDAGSARVVDGTGKHLTPGIIDEHTHIALFGINEVATNSSMVRMKDVVNSQDVNIYRNLAGGVVAAQQLHGSANPIGGQSSLIKMRWGATPDELQIADAPEFIKFALGENVKRSTNPASIRYPQSRMGVEQVYVNAFTEAQAYAERWRAYNALSNTQRRNAIAPRRDLVHETMLEILNGERYVSNHSYVQSEINMMMHMAESFGFRINTFTHILEGYKVADKMAAHGAGGSTFSDWWAFKWEVRYAIPYNAALMQQAGVVVALNSDDAEMSRRLNQEAGKMIKYGNVSETDALKMITLNPAKLLHLEDRMGSIRVGKDADLVLWNDHPLSVYAQAETTWVDGIAYYDRQRDQQLRQQIRDERARIIAAITAAKTNNAAAQ